MSNVPDPPRYGARVNYFPTADDLNSADMNIGNQASVMALVAGVNQDDPAALNLLVIDQQCRTYARHRVPFKFAVSGDQAQRGGYCMLPINATRSSQIMERLLEGYEREIELEHARVLALQKPATVDDTAPLSQPEPGDDQADQE